MKQVVLVLFGVQGDGEIRVVVCNGFCFFFGLGGQEFIGYLVRVFIIYIVEEKREEQVLGVLFQVIQWLKILGFYVFRLIFYIVINGNLNK